MNLDNIINLLKYNSQNPLTFISGYFLWFFILFVLIYAVFYKRVFARTFILLIFSYYFYYKTSGLYILLLFAVSSFDYLFLKSIIKYHNKKIIRSILFSLSIIFNIAVLGYFKYTNFFIEIINSTFNSTLSYIDIILPIGISFFTFQKLGLIIDVYRKNSTPPKNIFEFLTFVAYFPTVQSGPILRGNNFLPQLRQKERFLSDLSINISDEQIGKAVFLIICGLFKKAIISDYIGVNFVDRVFDNPTLYSGFENLFASYGYALQIYCDFSGYSDIAIGVSLLIGIKIPPNFNVPYKAKGIKDFWQRWHISLSTWLRDFLFLPIAYKVARLFKNKKFLRIKAETWSYHSATLLTMFICGLWHGASFTFVIWGILHGLGLSFERIFNSIFKFKKGKLSLFIGSFITFHFIVFCWIIFRSSGFENAFQICSQILNFDSYSIFLDVILGYKEVFIILLTGYILHYIPTKVDLFIENLIVKSPLILKATYLILAIWLISQMKLTSIQPFIYFNF
ncbi:MAG: MBOAT family protein [Ignavibacteria bacterium]|nr:MBOAT family protein [Ignavibacteria bacterium]